MIKMYAFCIFLEFMEFCILWDKNLDWRIVCYIGFGLYFILIQLLDKWSWGVLREYYIIHNGSFKEKNCMVSLFEIWTRLWNMGFRKDHLDFETHALGMCIGIQG